MATTSSAPLSLQPITYAARQRRASTAPSKQDGDTNMHKDMEVCSGVVHILTSDGEGEVRGSDVDYDQD